MSPVLCRNEASPVNAQSPRYTNDYRLGRYDGTKSLPDDSIFRVRQNHIRSALTSSWRHPTAAGDRGQTGSGGRLVLGSVSGNGQFGT